MSGEVTALFAAFCYSLSFVYLRKAQTERNLPDHGLLPILLISALTLAAAFGIKALSQPVVLNAISKWPMAALLSVTSGLVGTWLGRQTLYTAIDRLGATRGVVLKSASPVITLVIAFSLLGERPDDLDVPGLACLLLGLVWVIVERRWVSHRALSKWVNYGIALGLLSAVLQGTGHAMRKLGTAYPVSPVFSAAVDVLAALTGYSAALMVTGKLFRYLKVYWSFPKRYVIAAGLLSSAGVLLFFSAVSRAPVSTVSVIIGTEPILVALLSSVLLGKLEQLSWGVFVAAVLVAAGVILTSLDQHKPVFGPQPSVEQMTSAQVTLAERTSVVGIPSRLDFQNLASVHSWEGNFVRKK
ncbi:DMT family transporter [Alicyclobacillus tolerans]|uniref:DMT family transporter n=1 Tax=Alicyclobacillus tolerans TaxID=90970 RepID=UPI001F41AC91|nr:DMT family transporter [Alicyclobacillus tolerans]MCF8564059.1 DMT family transporter [Alicyclobacillus tolerans]